jgi:hypothetical protein
MALVESRPKSPASCVQRPDPMGYVLSRVRGGTPRSEMLKSGTGMEPSIGLAFGLCSTSKLAHRKSSPAQAKL